MFTGGGTSSGGKYGALSGGVEYGCAYCTAESTDECEMKTHVRSAHVGRVVRYLRVQRNGKHANVDKSIFGSNLPKR